MFLQIVKEFPSLCKPKCTLPCSQQPISRPLSQTSPVYFLSSFYFLKIILNNSILSLPSSSKWLLSLRSPQIILYGPLFPCTSQMSPNISPFPFNHPVTFSQQYCSCSSPLFSLLHSTVSQFLSATNISLITPFSNILSLCSSLSKRQQVLCTYINIQTIVIIFINCNLVVTRSQWLFYMYTNMKKELENLSLEGYTRKIQQQLGNWGTISAFAYRNRKTKKTKGNQYSSLY